MLRLRRILFPTDFSACAEAAFTHAAYLAQRTGAELHVLHVVEDGGGVLGDWVRDVHLTPADIAADLDVPVPVPLDEAERDANAPVPIIEVEETAPAAAPAILHYVEDNDIDLVVMGTHGQRGLRRMLMGSVAEEVVRLAPCPVFTVGGREAGDRSWAVRHVVAPVDLSDYSMHAARHAAALAEVYGADLVLLLVVDTAALPTSMLPAVGTAHVAPEEAERRARKALKRVAVALANEYPVIGPVGWFVRTGRPATEIADFAAEHGTDLLVLGSHGRTGMERLLIGSVAEQVIRTAPCPVFTIKSYGRTLQPVEESHGARASQAEVAH